MLADVFAAGTRTFTVTGATGVVFSDLVGGVGRECDVERPLTVTTVVLFTEADESFVGVPSSGPSSSAAIVGREGTSPTSSSSSMGIEARDLVLGVGTSTSSPSHASRPAASPGAYSVTFSGCRAPELTVKKNYTCQTIEISTRLTVTYF